MIIPTAADLSGAQRSELSTQLRDEPSSSNHNEESPPPAKETGQFRRLAPGDVDQPCQQAENGRGEDGQHVVEEHG